MSFKNFSGKFGFFKKKMAYQKIARHFTLIYQIVYKLIKTTMQDVASLTQLCTY